MLTGQAALEGVSSAINEANLYRFIAKPWEKKDLFLTVKEAIKIYEADQKIEEQEQLITQLNKGIKQFAESDDHGGYAAETEAKLYEQELYDQLFFIRYFRILSAEAREWLSKAAIGLICSDNRVTYAEKYFIEAIVKNDPVKERVEEYIQMVQEMVRPELRKLNVDRRSALNMLDSLAWILVANRSIRFKEEQYFIYIAESLGLKEHIAREYIHVVKVKIKGNHLHRQISKNFSE